MNSTQPTTYLLVACVMIASTIAACLLALKIDTENHVQDGTIWRIHGATYSCVKVEK